MQSYWRYTVAVCTPLCLFEFVGQFFLFLLLRFCLLIRTVIYITINNGHFFLFANDDKGDHQLSGKTCKWQYFFVVSNNVLDWSGRVKIELSLFKNIVKVNCSVSQVYLMSKATVDLTSSSNRIHWSYVFSIVFGCQWININKKMGLAEVNDFDNLLKIKSLKSSAETKNIP